MGTRLNTRSSARRRPRVGAAGARRGEGRAPQGIDLHRLAGTADPSGNDRARGIRRHPRSDNSRTLLAALERCSSSVSVTSAPRGGGETKACALAASTGSRVCRRSQVLSSYAPASSTPCGGTERQARSASAPLRRELEPGLRAGKARSPRPIQTIVPRRRRRSIRRAPMATREIQARVVFVYGRLTRGRRGGPRSRGEGSERACKEHAGRVRAEG